MSNEASASGLSLEGVDDVEEFVRSNEGDTMSRQRYSRLYDLMQMGNQAFRDNLLKRQSVVTQEPIILNHVILLYLATDVLLISGFANSWYADLHQTLKIDSGTQKVGVVPVEEKMTEVHRLRWFGHVLRRPLNVPL